MPTHALTNLIIVLLHVVGGPRRHRRHGHRGGRCHHRQVVAPADPPPPSATPHRRVLERPRPLLPIDRCSQTLTPIKGVVRVGHAPSMVGIAPTGLHRSMTLHHRAIRGRRREEKKMKTAAAKSRWSLAPLGRR
jgi:hypothetical protein